MAGLGVGFLLNINLELLCFVTEHEIFFQEKKESHYENVKRYIINTRYCKGPIAQCTPSTQHIHSLEWCHHTHGW